jgi:peptidoglycan hydrolase-like protein with peptidoglycan-binding domain
MKSLRTIVPAAACVALVACGTTPTDRTLGGAGVGAAAGAAVGAISSLSLLQGTLIGATAGALTGVLTDANTINLGRPPWTKPGATSRGTPSSDTQNVKTIQSGLKQHGLYAGPLDGIAGPKTTAAIRAYQRENGLLQDGRATPELASHIEQRG